MSRLAYVYDGSVEGLFTAMFRSFERKEAPEDVMKRSALQLRLGEEPFFVETDFEAASRAARGLGRVAGRRALEAVATAALSDDPSAGSACLRLFHRAFREAGPGRGPAACSGCPKKRSCGSPCAKVARTDVMADIADPTVAAVLSLERAVVNERHRMLQFLRFEELEGGVWFARCNPNASVVPLLMGHFAERFNSQDFMIHDEVHGLVGLFASDSSGRGLALPDGGTSLDRFQGRLPGKRGRCGGRWWLAKVDELSLPEETRDEKTMKRAWRAFYDSVSVEARYNPELRRSFVPVRLWRNITELR